MGERPRTDLPWREEAARAAFPIRSGVGRGLLAACLAMLCVAWLCAASGAEEVQTEQKVWQAGNYTFSDELGGFTIRSVAGIGTAADPIVIEEELYSASPVTLTVRVASFNYRSDAPNLASGPVFIRTVVKNAGGQAWVEFEFELQEILHQSSVFDDGLSFDQRKEQSHSIGSSKFARYSRDFEPYDRLRFTEGKLDSGETGEFSFPLTDFTPRWTFFIVQDPRIPYS